MGNKVSALGGGGWIAVETVPSSGKMTNSRAFRWPVGSVNGGPIRKDNKDWWLTLHSRACGTSFTVVFLSNSVEKLCRCHKTWQTTGHLFCRDVSLHQMVWFVELSGFCEWILLYHFPLKIGQQSHRLCYVSYHHTACQCCFTSGNLSTRLLGCYLIPQRKFLKHLDQLLKSV